MAKDIFMEKTPEESFRQALINWQIQLRLH